MPWPIKEISLAKIIQEAKEENLYMVIVDDPATVRALEKNVPSGYYVEGEEMRLVYTRPLWPNEPHFSYDDLIPTPTPIIPSGTTITCKPEDGTLPAP